MHAEQRRQRVLSRPVWRSPLWDLLLLALFPAIMIYVNDSWTILAPVLWTDPYFYTGYFLDLSGHLRDFGPTYYGSRLPWVLLGNAAFALGDPEVSNMLLRLLLVYVGIAALMASFCV